MPILAGNMPALSVWPCEGHKSNCISVVNRNSITNYTVKNKAEAPDEYPDLSGNQSKYIWISVHPSLLDKFPV